MASFLFNFNPLGEIEEALILTHRNIDLMLKKGS